MVEATGDGIHILDYPNPNVDTLLVLPNDRLVKQLKDLWLHWWDLMEVQQCL